MVWKGCLPIISVLATVLIVLPTIGESKQTEDNWKCHKCHPGSYVAQECSTESGTRCAPCPAGTFNDHFNMLFQCKPCSTCPTGQHQQAACNREHDTTCVTEPMTDEGSGELPKEKESKFSNIFTDKNGAKVKYSDIPHLSKVEKSEEEPNQEELSGDTPIKPHLFNMNSFESRHTKTHKPMRDPTEEATLTTVSLPDEVTTARLPENEAQIDDLIPIQDTKVEAQLTTTTIDTDAEGSATSTLAIEEYPEPTTKTPVPPEIAVSEAPKSSSKPDIESTLSTLSTTLVVQVPEVVTKTAFDTFNEIAEPIKPSAAVSNVSVKIVAETTNVVPVSTTASQIEVTTILTEVPSTTKQPMIFSEIDSGSDSEEKADSEPESDEETETTRSPVVTIVATTSAAPDVDTSTVTEPFAATTVFLKKIVAPLGDTIDEDVAMRNKTPISEIIPLLSTTARTDKDSAGNLLTTTAGSDSESTSKDSDAISSVVPTDLTTPEHSHPWINGSELQQEPAVDNAGTEDNKHLDVAIAAVITGIGLVVLAVIAVRYCLKKRTFKDMRRAQEDQMRIQMNEDKQLKRKDSQTDDSFQTAIYDDIELQAINGGAKHLNGKANGHCKDSNNTSANNDIMSAVNCNYKPADDTNTLSNTSPADKAPVETLYAVPNKLVRGEPAEPLLNDKSQTTEKGETTTTPGFRLDILDNLKYIDETTDEEGEYVPSRMYLRQAPDEVYSSAEDLLLHGTNNLDAIAEESTPMLRRQPGDQS